MNNAASAEMVRLLEVIADQSREIAALKAELETICKWPMHKKIELRNRYYAAKKLRQADLAAELGVSVAFVSKIIRQADTHLALPPNA